MTDFDDLLLRSEEPFAFGAARYWDAHPELGESQPRVYVRFRPQGVDPSRSFLALLDTGAHYCILNTALVELISDQLTESMGTIKLRTAHGPVQGRLYRYKITLVAETGRDLFIESTLFVPPEWRASNFLGYVGVLDRLRFAVHPRRNRFYFGPLE